MVDHLNGRPEKEPSLPVLPTVPAGPAYEKMTYFPNHPIPHIVHFLAVLPIGHQVKVIGELHRSGKLLEDIDAEPLAAFFNVHAFIGRIAVEKIPGR